MLGFSFSIKIVFTKSAGMYDELACCFEKPLFEMCKKVKYFFTKTKPRESFHFSLLSASGAIAFNYRCITIQADCGHVKDLDWKVIVLLFIIFFETNEESGRPTFFLLAVVRLIRC